MRGDTLGKRILRASESLRGWSRHESERLSSSIGTVNGTFPSAAQTGTTIDLVATPAGSVFD